MKWEVQRRPILYFNSIFHKALPSLFLSPGSHAPNLIFISCRRSGIFCIKDLHKLGKSHNVNEIGTGTVRLVLFFYLNGLIAQKQKSGRWGGKQIEDVFKVLALCRYGTVFTVIASFLAISS
jgi:hypothetical protein